MSEVRVRFAPSPTGPLHIGGVRTALYNYLYAKKHGGKLILRIEDTDQTRYVPGAEEYIQQALEWCGISFDEGPKEGGPNGPYRQSERKDMYAEYTQQLIDAGHAYYAFDTADELNEMRERLKAARVASPQYNAITRVNMKNSLTLPEDEVKERLASGDPYVVRLKVPRKEEVRLNDMVRGWVMVHSSAIDDKVLLKSDGMPTYHLANVVDDHLMDITHVIRGEEWLPSAPLHVLLYKFLGWEETMPTFAHLPLLLKPDGNGKLSKRDAEKHGFPIYPTEWTDPETKQVSAGFREEGYLPEAFTNFLAFLGWNPGTHEELFSMEELQKAFTIERVGKAGVKFDIQKANWYNEQYIKGMSDEALAPYLTEGLKTYNLTCSEAVAKKVSGLMKERIQFPKDLAKEALFFFEEPKAYDEKVVEKKWTEEVVQVVETYKKTLEGLDNITPEVAKEAFMDLLEAKSLKVGMVMPALRVAITGAGSGPDLMEIITILGKEETVKRIDKAINTLQVKA